MTLEISTAVAEGAGPEATAAGTSGVGNSVLTGGGDAKHTAAQGTDGATAQTDQAAAGAGNADQGAAAGKDGSETVADASVEYSDFSVPEGVSLNPELLGEFKDIAKGLGLKQEAAQQLTDLGVKLTQKLLAEQAAAETARNAAWLEATRNDKEFGGEKLNENLAFAARAMQAFATPELKAVLDQTGLGNHPELIRAMVKAGKLISEDALVPGGTRPAGKANGKTLNEQRANVLYGGG